MMNKEMKRDTRIGLSIGMALMLIVLVLDFGGFILEMAGLMIITTVAMKYRHHNKYFQLALWLFPVIYSLAILFDPYLVPIFGNVPSTLYESLIFNTITFSGYLAGVSTWMIKERTSTWRHGL